MKKILAVLLSLALLIAGVALAENTTVSQNGGEAKTLVKYTVAEQVGFIVTIPSGVTLSQAAPDAAEVTGQMTVSLEAKTFNVPGQGITVKLADSANAFTLVNGANPAVAYTVSQNGAEIAEGATVLTWTCEANGAKTASATLDLAAAYNENLAAGDYTDTLTFTVSAN